MGRRDTRNIPLRRKYYKLKRLSKGNLRGRINIYKNVQSHFITLTGSVIDTSWRLTKGGDRHPSSFKNRRMYLRGSPSRYLKLNKAGPFYLKGMLGASFKKPLKPSNQRRKRIKDAALRLRQSSQTNSLLTKGISRRKPISWHFLQLAVAAKQDTGNLLQVNFSYPFTTNFTKLLPSVYTKPGVMLNLVPSFPVPASQINAQLHPIRVLRDFPSYTYVGGSLQYPNELHQTRQANHYLIRRNGTFIEDYSQTHGLEDIFYLTLFRRRRSRFAYNTKYMLTAYQSYDFNYKKTWTAVFGFMNWYKGVSNSSRLSLRYDSIAYLDDNFDIFLSEPSLTPTMPLPRLHSLVFYRDYSRILGGLRVVRPNIETHTESTSYGSRKWYRWVSDSVTENHKQSLFRATFLSILLKTTTSLSNIASTGPTKPTSIPKERFDYVLSRWGRGRYLARKGTNQFTKLRPWRDFLAQKQFSYRTKFPRIYTTRKRFFRSSASNTRKRPFLYSRKRLLRSYVYTILRRRRDTKRVYRRLAAPTKPYLRHFRHSAWVKPRSTFRRSPAQHLLNYLRRGASIRKRRLKYARGRQRKYYWLRHFRRSMLKLPRTKVPTRSLPHHHKYYPTLPVNSQSTTYLGLGVLGLPKYPLSLKNCLKFFNPGHSSAFLPAYFWRGMRYYRTTLIRRISRRSSRKNPKRKLRLLYGSRRKIAKHALWNYTNVFWRRKKNIISKASRWSTIRKRNYLRFTRRRVLSSFRKLRFRITARRRTKFLTRAGSLKDSNFFILNSYGRSLNRRLFWLTSINYYQSPLTSLLTRTPSKFFKKYIASSKLSLRWGDLRFAGKFSQTLRPYSAVTSADPNTYFGGFNAQNHLPYHLVSTLQSNITVLKTTLLNPLLLKWLVAVTGISDSFNNIRNFTQKFSKSEFIHTNLIPSLPLNTYLNNKMYSRLFVEVFQKQINLWYNNLVVRFLEFIYGYAVIFQFSPFLDRIVAKDHALVYKVWMRKMGYYERRLGHKFFLQEGVHLIHISFYEKDAKLLFYWLKTIIQRISFWKTRFIFRFLKYIFLSHFQFYFTNLRAKGFKVKLKGKISVAGNSRKRTILFRAGKTSYTSVNLRVIYHKGTIVTFTGVMGFQIWIFF